MRPGQGAGSDRGFTMIEALVALAIGGFVIASLATVTGQWLRGWRIGFPVLQRSEMLAVGLDRIAADLAAARYMPLSATAPGVNFSGDSTSVTLVRRTLPVQSPAGLELVQLAPPVGRGEASLCRRRSPLPFGSAATTPNDRSPVVLMRSPYAIRFSYADADRQWRSTWRGLLRLPRLVRVEVVDGASGRPVLPARVVGLHVDAPGQCAFAGSARACDAAMALDAGQPARDGGQAAAGQL